MCFEQLLGVFQRPLTLILLKKYRDNKWVAYRDTNWWCMVYVLLSAKGRAFFCKSIAIEMGGVHPDTKLLRKYFPGIFFWRSFSRNYVPNA